ncbi:MAG TPA: hypothetical protein VHQ64_08940 [Pyrinomonadaceae bacterium]|nr:hypothetical protein [Pyrinomonadaceae bacterium]
MKMPTTSRNAPAIVFFALLVMLGSAIVSYSQGRGNGKGGGPNIDKKCAKFVNCHDARDGRWDGRGPAINQGNTIPIYQPPYQPPVVAYPNGRVRNPNQDNQVYYPRSRNRRVRGTSDDDNVTRTEHRGRRRTTSDDTETRDRRTRRRDRSNVID